jgi:hypothetical protein
MAIILFWLGDLVSRPMWRYDFGFLYPIYNNLMIWSSNIQDWGSANGPWKKPEDHTST